MKRIFLVLGVVLAASQALAVDFPAPTPEIVAPSTPVKPGRIIKLEVKPLVNPPANLTSTSYAWTVHVTALPPGITDEKTVSDLIVDRLDGTIAFWGSREDGYEFVATLITTYSYADWDTKTLVTKNATSEVVINTSESPSPSPSPSPTLPNGKFGLAQVTYDAVMVLPVANKAVIAQSLAKNYRAEVVSIESAGGAVTPQQIINATASSNAATLGTQLSTWKPALDAMAASANSQKDKFQTVDDWKTAWSEIALGLESVK